MKELAVFASSEAGEIYAQVERFWGRDPAAFLEPVDDVLAHNLRAGLFVALNWDAGKTTDDAARHRELVDKARSIGAELRGVSGG